MMRYDEGLMSACYFITMIGIVVTGLMIGVVLSVYVYFWSFLPILGVTIFLTIWATSYIADYFVKRSKS